MTRRVADIIACLIIVFSVFSLSQPVAIKALAGNEFQAGRIIDDAIFFDSNGLTLQQIQTFLNAKVPVCDTNGTKPYGGTTRAAYGASVGNPTPYVCLKDFRQDTTNKPVESGLCNGHTAGNKSAAQIIYEVSQSCGINPKVLLVLLQKEQSLVTDDWPWTQQYRSATGYGCPDTAPCDAEYYGFFNQIYAAARQFKRYARNAGSYNYRLNRNNYIQYNPNTGCGGTNVFIQNQATAGLYNYTPYQPNAAALNNLYGTGDSCSAYGNRNFWRMYNDWFGSPLSNKPFLTNTSHPDGTLIQEAGRLEIYLIKNQQRYHIPDLSVFSSYNFRWEDVRAATLKDLSMPISTDKLSYRSGTLIRGNTDTKVYYLNCTLTSCTKRHIDTIDLFSKLGYKASQVYIVEQSQVDAMSETSPLTDTNVHPQDSLFIDPQTNKVYIVGIGARHWIPNLDVFKANHFSWEWVRPALAGDLELPESILWFPEGTLVRAGNSPNVFALDQDELGNYSKRYVSNQNVFGGLGYTPNDVYIVDPTTLPSPNGIDLTE